MEETWEIEKLWGEMKDGERRGRWKERENEEVDGQKLGREMRDIGDLERAEIFDKE